MPVEFIGMISTQDQSETRPSSGPVIDKDYVRRFARAHEDAGFDRVLIGYNSSQPDGTQVAAYAAAHTERLGFLVAHRPGFMAPTLAARTFATLDQFTGGRALGGAARGNRRADRLGPRRGRRGRPSRATADQRVVPATGAAGNSTALVGTPETVARALLDYVDIGVSTLLLRGYDPYDDAVDYGQALLPLVRDEIACRERHLGPARPAQRGLEGDPVA
jgi:alkanesulfonate monooxygenase SsuD/methylene tetrahydromethanopterin reductase-like flavin-dependent oxidoreductase (luciferase family)